MNCRICGNASRVIFGAKLLNKYNVNYYYCSVCGFLQTEEPFWLAEAYKNPINITDTGYIKRNVSLSKITFLIALTFFGTRSKFLDYAGGYGMLTRIMRDYGLDYYWDDLFTKNIFSEGFENKFDKYDLISCFECFEHLAKPIDEIEKMLNLSKSILFSTILIDKSNIPQPEDWWYYGLEHGQHISFYSLKTLNFIADKFKLNIYSDGKGMHLLTDKKISNFKFKLLILLSRTPFDLFVISSVFGKSKTMTDHDNLIKR